MGKKIYAVDTVYGYRTDTLANWQAENPVLYHGEPVIVLDGEDGNWLKIGDGVTPFNDLPYMRGPQGPRGEKGDNGVDGTISFNELTEEQLVSLKGDKGDNGKDADMSLISNALKGNKSGETIKITDISPLEHTLKIKVRGVENLNAVSVVCHRGYKIDTSSKKVKDFTIEYSVPDDCRFVKITFPHKGKLYTRCQEHGTWHHNLNDYFYGNDLALLKGVRFVKPNTIHRVTYDYTDTTLQTQQCLLNEKNLTQLGISRIGGADTFKLKHSESLSNPGICVPYSELCGIPYGSKQQAYVVYEVEPGTTFEVDFRLATGALYGFNKETVAHITNEPWEFVIESVYDYDTLPKYSVNEDGTVEGIKSFYPYMTLATDTSGAIIDVEYNRDLNKVYDELLQSFSMAYTELKNAIIYLGGTL